VGSVGDSYDNALAESVIGLYKTEVIRKRGPWRHLEDVEFATLVWFDWFNKKRLLEPMEMFHQQSSKKRTIKVGGLAPLGRSHAKKSPEEPGRFSDGTREGGGRQWPLQ
jgi:transposase InsO family protein